MSSLSYNKSRIIIFRAFLGIDVNEKSDDDPTISKENPPGKTILYSISYGPYVNFKKPRALKVIIFERITPGKFFDTTDTLRMIFG